MSLSTAAVAAPRLTAEPFRTRRTFAIISHPDAGKTTLTERLLAAAGAIQQAGAEVRMVASPQHIRVCEETSNS